MKSLEELKVKLRNDFEFYMRNNYIKDKCERCESTENLHLHHVEYFSKELNYILELLGLNDKNEFNEKEIEMIRYMMLGIQCKNNKYLTLCDDCHKKEHSIYGNGRSHKLTREEKYNRYLNGDITITLEEKDLNKWYTKEELKELCDSLNIRNSRGKLIGTTSFMKVLDDSYYVVTKSRKKVDGVRNMYYMINKKRCRRKKL